MRVTYSQDSYFIIGGNIWLHGEISYKIQFYLAILSLMKEDKDAFTVLVIPY
jgi:hypothetical protein